MRRELEKGCELLVYWKIWVLVGVVSPPDLDFILQNRVYKLSRSFTTRYGGIKKTPFI